MRATPTVSIHTHKHRFTIQKSAKRYIRLNTSYKNATNCPQLCDTRDHLPRFTFDCNLLLHSWCCKDLCFRFKIARINEKQSSISARNIIQTQTTDVNNRMKFTSRPSEIFIIPINTITLKEETEFGSALTSYAFGEQCVKM